jgi:hypothetical protein
VRDLLLGFDGWVSVREGSRQVFPRGVVQFDQSDFLFAPPGLDFLLACNGSVNVAEVFDVNQAEDLVPRSEPRNETLAVFEESFLDVAVMPIQRVRERLARI